MSEHRNYPQGCIEVHDERLASQVYPSNAMQKTIVGLSGDKLTTSKDLKSSGSALLSSGAKQAAGGSNPSCKESISADPEDTPDLQMKLGKDRVNWKKILNVDQTT